MPDIVVDTNVWVHATDRGDGLLSDDAAAFVVRLLESRTSICVDPGACIPATATTSRIWAEYRDQQLLNPARAEYFVLAALYSDQRVTEVAPRTNTRYTKVLRRLIYDKDDRIFVRVAVETNDQTLVSNDGDYLEHCTKREFRRALGVTLCAPRAAVT